VTGLVLCCQGRYMFIVTVVKLVRLSKHTRINSDRSKKLTRQRRESDDDALCQGLLRSKDACAIDWTAVLAYLLAGPSVGPCRNRHSRHW
jgi:hypothetical protein